MSAVFCPQHSKDVPDGSRVEHKLGKYVGHHFQIVVPAATGIWKWTYITHLGTKRMGLWLWMFMCARHAFTRRFEEPEIDGCPGCKPVLAQDPALSRDLGTAEVI